MAGNEPWAILPLWCLAEALLNLYETAVRASAAVPPATRGLWFSALPPLAREFAPVLKRFSSFLPIDLLAALMDGFGYLLPYDHPNQRMALAVWTHALESAARSPVRVATLLLKRLVGASDTPSLYASSGLLYRPFHSYVTVVRRRSAGLSPTSALTSPGPTQTTAVCEACGQPLKGPPSANGSEDSDVVTALGQTVHAHCFTCARCHSQLSAEYGEYWELQGRVYCNECFVVQCRTCCHRCSHFTTPPDRVPTALGPYHPACLICTDCGKSLASLFAPTHAQATATATPDGCRVERNDFICADCFALKHETNCGICKKAITNQYVKLGAQTYHPECVVCASCGKLLAGQRLFKDKHTDAFYCPDCR